MKRTRFTLDDLAGQEPVIDDRDADALATTLGRRAPVVCQGREPLFIGDQVAGQQELAEPNWLEGRDGLRGYALHVGGGHYSGVGHLSTETFWGNSWSYIVVRA